MPKIYSQAQSVLIWLGENVSGLEGVGESILQAQTLLPTEAIDKKMLQEASDGLLEGVATNRRNNQMNWLDHDWESIAELLSRPWFRRKWVIQETVLAREATVICGEIVFPWKNLAALALRLTQLGLVSLLTVGVTMSRPLHNISILMLLQHYHDVLTLFDAVHATSNFLCGDARDHVFALLSLVKDASLIQPDYTLTAGELFQKFAVYCLERGEFNILSLAPNTLSIPRPDMPTLSLPTWVPDLTRQGDFDSLSSYTVRGQLFNAGGSADANPPMVSNDRYLHLRGFILDSISVVSQSFPEINSNRLPDHLGSKWLKDDKDARGTEWHFGLWLQRCRHFFADQDGQLGRGESGAFYRTMTCQLTGMHDREPRDLSEAFAAFIEYRLALHLEGNTTGSGPVYELYHQHGTSFGHLVWAIPAARRLCKTANGHYGLVLYLCSLNLKTSFVSSEGRKRRLL
jgi:hypothetical protein